MESPVVKLKGLGPPAPKLLWEPIKKGVDDAGEVLVAFELFLVRKILILSVTMRYRHRHHYHHHNHHYHHHHPSTEEQSTVSRLQLAPNAHNIILLEMRIIVDPFLVLTEKKTYAVSLGIFSWGGGGGWAQKAKKC